MTRSGQPASRLVTITSFGALGLAGLSLLLFVTITRLDQTASIYASLGPRGAALIAIFAVFCLTLALLRFELTSLVFVNLVIIAFNAMFPLLGMVISGWIASLTAMIPRLLAVFGWGPSRIDSSDPALEWTKMFGLFGIYGIPVIVATWTFELTGGQIPIS
ncbi:MAG: hypothetical protein R3338_12620, partial [Thermoanaerobaculia bacterium]|nr:hypothetical protein [Thermoanaerobaculia bacterium]